MEAHCHVQIVDIYKRLIGHRYAKCEVGGALFKFKLLLVIVLAAFAYIQWDQSNRDSIDSFNYLTGVGFILIIAFVSILLDWFDRKNQIQADKDIKELTLNVQTSKNIQELQLAELNQLRFETNLLHDIGSTQLQAIQYSQELGQEIGKVYFRIKLKHRLLFQDVCPFGFLVEINTINNPKIARRFFVRNGDVRNNNLMCESYTYYQVQDDGQCIGGHQCGSINTVEVENIVATLDFPANAGLLKDFHDEKLHIWLPENLLNQSDFIELVVNGWAILHRQIEQSDWRRSDIYQMRPKFEFNEFKYFENWNENLNVQRYAGWRIDLFKNIPTKHLAGISRWSGF